MTRRPRATPRGVSLIEAMVSIVVLAVGILGLAGLQIISARSNSFGQRLGIANELMTDLAENVQRWPYGDPRLAALSTVHSTTDTAITSRVSPATTDRSSTVTTKYEFAESAADPNGTTSNALLLGTYEGLVTSAYTRADGSQIFQRYWNVWDVDLTNSGTPQGKLVQVVVRWSEAGLGMREVSTTTFVTNPNALYQ